jgi:hypothetical protein
MTAGANANRHAARLPRPWRLSRARIWSEAGAGKTLRPLPERRARCRLMGREHDRRYQLAQALRVIQVLTAPRRAVSAGGVDAGARLALRFGAGAGQGCSQNGRQISAALRHVHLQPMTALQPFQECSAGNCFGASKETNIQARATSNIVDCKRNHGRVKIDAD